MPDYYDGNSANYPVHVAIIDDADTPDASNFNLAPQDLADRTAWIKARFINGLDGGEYTPDPLVFAKGSTVIFNGEVDVGSKVYVAGDEVTSITVTAGGSGYTSPPTVTVDPPPAIPGRTTVQATATAVLTGGVVTSITMTNTGTGYAAVPGVTITGGGGAGATARANVQAFVFFQSGAETHYQNGSGLIFESGSGVSAKSGSAFAFDSGSNVDFLGTFSLGGAFHVEIGGTFYVDSSGTLQVSTNGKLQLARGQDFVIQDQTYPTFTSPIGTSVVQPFHFLPGSSSPGSGSSFDTLVDGMGNFYNGCTRVVNGATVNSITVRVLWTAHGAPPNVAQLIFYKTDVTTGARTTIASRAIDTTSGTGGDLTLTVPGTEILDATKDQYVIALIGENGLGAQSLTWSPPMMNISIPTLGGI